MSVEKLRKRCGFVIYSYLKDNAFTAVKRDTEVYTGYRHKLSTTPGILGLKRFRSTKTIFSDGIFSP